MTNETCHHCGRPKYEFIDVCRGAAKPEVVCCDAAQSSGWISIDDRLPEPRKTVLLSIEFLTATEDADGHWTEEHGSIVELGELTPSDGGDYFQAYASHGTHEYISHWMPLPDPMPVRKQEAPL